MSPPTLVSACLAGLCTDWCGRDARLGWIWDAVARGEAIPVCPEQLGGLPTPRVPAERGGDRVVSLTGEDVTEQYRRGAERALEIARAHGCRAAILKARSPACGLGEIYDGSFSHRLVAGEGVACELLRREGIEVHTEETANPELLKG